MTESKTEYIATKMGEISNLFQNPVLTLIVRADDIPGGSLIITADNVTNSINALKAFRLAMNPQKITIEGLVELHKDLQATLSFIGLVLPENIQPEELEAFTQCSLVIEKMVKQLKKSAIAHQFK